LLKTRLIAAAFLKCGNKILMMHRGMHRELAPGMWAAIGGHLEPHEINSPQAACLREVEEEAGIRPDMIKNLRLRYITMRDAGDEIRIGYYFFGELETFPELLKSDEGEFHWMDISALTDKPMTFTVAQITAHWLNRQNNNEAWILTANRADNRAEWTRLIEYQ